MKLRTRARKANGMTSGGYWYIASEYVREDGSPCFTMSLNVDKAKHFATKEEAHAFNRKFMAIGMISAPFEIVK